MCRPRAAFCPDQSTRWALWGPVTTFLQRPEALDGSPSQKLQEHVRRVPTLGPFDSLLGAGTCTTAVQLLLVPPRSTPPRTKVPAPALDRPGSLECRKSSPVTSCKRLAIRDRDLCSNPRQHSEVCSPSCFDSLTGFFICRFACSSTD